MKRRTLESILISITMITGFLSWFVVDRAITVVDSSTWAIPILCFSLYIIAICLSIILVRDTLLLELALLASMLLSFIFVRDIFHIFGIIIATYCIAMSTHKIRRDLDLNVKVSLWKSLHVGRVMLLLALSITVTSQYYVTIGKTDGEKNIPQFDLSLISSKVVMPMLATFNPSFKMITDDELTVDQFILQAQDDMSPNGQTDSLEELIEEQLPQSLTPEEKEQIKAQEMEKIAAAQSQMKQKNKELILGEGRRQLATMVGHEISGQEKISAVFTGLINKKMNDYFRPDVTQGKKHSPFPIILALILFLTVYPIGSILSNIWFLITKLVFSLLLKMKVIKINSITVEKQVIE